MENKKSNKGLIITIIILIILLLGATGYICYDKGVFKFNKQEIVTKPNNNKQLRLTEEEVSNIVKNIPYATNNTSNKNFTAYAEQTQLNTIDKKLLIQFAINNLDLTTYEEGMPKFVNEDNGYKYSKEEESAPAEGYFSLDKVANFIKDKYNLDIDVDSLTEKNGYVTNAPGCGSIYYVNNYFCYLCSKGGTGITKVSDIVDYKLKNNKLIITEKVGFLYTELTSSNLYKDNFAKTNALLENENIGQKPEEQLEKAKKYLSENKEKFNSYKHTFNIVNEKYYWNSTELIQ